MDSLPPHQLPVGPYLTPQDKRERWLKLEMGLEAAQIENRFLKEENDKLKERLDNFEKDAKSKQEQIKKMEGETKVTLQELNELHWEKEKLIGKQGELSLAKNSWKKLYSVAGTMMDGLGGEVPPIKSVEGEGNIQNLEEFCASLQRKFSEWLEGHQLMHNELEKTLKTVEEFAGQCGISGDRNGSVSSNDDDVDLDDDDDNQEDVQMSEEAPASPVSTSSSSSNHKVNRPGLSNLKRRNPLRKCRLAINSYDEDTAFWDSEFACQGCGDAFCRLAHVRSQLGRAGESDMITNHVSKAKIAKMEEEGSSFRHPDETGRMNGNDPAMMSIKKIQSEGDAIQSKRKPDWEGVELPSGKIHKYAGSFMTIQPIEQILSLQNGTPPLKKRRCFCSCGKNFAFLTSLFYHIKSVGAGNVNGSAE